jgi:thiamine-monophosphate kinase
MIARCSISAFRAEYVLFKTDAVVEGIHFTSETPPEKVGRKALARCLSDIAAMAGAANSALVTIALPRDFEPARIQAIYAGLNALASEHGVAIAGGETTTNPERILISIALLGTVRKNDVFSAPAPKLATRFLSPENLAARFTTNIWISNRAWKEARWLTEHFRIHSMIDLSDGLASDLRHILQASQVGAELLTSAIPISREAKLAARAESSAKPPLLAALTDGEDFELLFTVRSQDAVPLLDGWKKQFADVPLACIGKITAEPGLRLRDKKGVRPLTVHGYTHFEKP